MTDDDAHRFSVAGPQSRQWPERLARPRLARIVGAYLAACFAAAIVLPIGFLLGDVIGGRPLAIHASDWLVLPVGLFLVSVIAAAPFATLAIVVAETFRLAAWPAYLAAGALVGGIAEASIGLLHLAGSGAGSGGPSFDPLLYLLVAGVGALAGEVYWLIGVRHRRIVAAR